MSEARELLEDAAEPGLRILAEMLEEAAERRRLRVVTSEEGDQE